MNNSIVKIEKLKKVFKTEKGENIALQDINLQIKKGEIYGIIGLSGAGKSTLVRMMNMLTTPTEGKVYFEDKLLTELSDAELRKVRKEIGMIFQSFNLLEQSNVFKNVRFPLEIMNADKTYADNKVMELLKLVDLDTKAKEYPSKLSGGQKQRVAIARALATNPKVLLCDEATSALDPKTTSQILSLLKKINKEYGVTIVIITHQMNVIESICDRVAIIDKSVIVEEGDVKEIFKNPKSDIGKRLIFGASDAKDDDFVNLSGKKCLRLVFDGNVTNEPIITDMVLKTGVPVSILYANVKEIENKPYGQLVIELPDEKNIQDKMKEYLSNMKVTYMEVS